MKKTFTLLSMLTVSTLVFGQSAKTKITAPKLTEQKLPATKTSVLTQKTQPSVGGLNKGGLASPTALIWSDSFNSPNGGKWTFSTEAGASANNWVIKTSTVNASSYSITPINSTTKATGFAMFDSDNLCGGNQIANMTNSATNTISCVGHPFVTLEFQQQYRRFYDSTFVFVSGDGGVNYTKYVVNENMGNNDGLATNPEIVKINISAAAGNSANVKVRWQFYSPSTLPGSPGCAYSWYIDDAKIYDMPTNELTIDRGYSDQIYIDGGLYTQVPSSQVMPIGFRADVVNKGSSAQTNVVLTTNVNSANGGNLFTGTSATLPSLGYEGVSNLTVTTTFNLPAVNDTYTVGFSVAQTETDEDLSNNSVNHFIEVNDSVFARDNGVISARSSPNYYTDGTSGSEIATIYEISAPATANSISAYIAFGSSAGAEALANLYLYSPNGDKTLVGSSAAYSVNDPNADTDKWVTFSFGAGISLDKDSTYLASILTMGAVDPAAVPAIVLVIGADKVTSQPPNSIQSLVFLQGANFGSGTWYNNSPENPMIRLNLAFTPTGVKNLTTNNSNVLGQNIPNPFSKESSVTYKLATDANSVLFTVTDVMGRVISSKKIESSKGTHSIKLENYSAGLYYYSLNVDGKITTKKMIVE
jgi:hypothetical protein